MKKFAQPGPYPPLDSEILHEDFEDDDVNGIIQSEMSGNIVGAQRLLNAGYQGNYGLDVRGDWIGNHYQIPPSVLGGQTIKAISFWHKPSFRLPGAFNFFIWTIMKMEYCGVLQTVRIFHIRC